MQESLEERKEKLVTMKMLLASEVKRESQDISAYLMTKERSHSLKKKKIAAKLHETEAKAQRAKMKVSKQKTKRISRIYEKRREAEETLKGK